MSDPAALPIPQASPGDEYRALRAEIDSAVSRVFLSGWYVLGREVDAFEAEFAAYLGVVGAVGVASGTDAVELALRALEIGPGDGVFTVSHTAVATVAAIERAGAVPILLDVDPATYTLDPGRLEAALAAGRPGVRPRAVVPVHLYGHPADMPAILAIARRRGLLVVEDCAQAHGAAIGGRQVGTFGDAAAFSFYPTKNLGALGDGGLVAATDVSVLARLRQLRQYGWRERYISASVGTNSRLDELQAAILRVKLTHLDERNERRRAIARRYDAGLAGAVLATPTVGTGDRHAYHQYVVRSAHRDHLANALARDGIGTAIHYPVPVHRQPAYSNRLPVPHDLAVTDRLVTEILSLPMYPDLADAAVDKVIAGIRAAVGATTWP
jgi:dTDP-4-amino-4,6-dideoxygalactose transaminase